MGCQESVFASSKQSTNLVVKLQESVSPCPTLTPQGCVLSPIHFVLKQNKLVLEPASEKKMMTQKLCFFKVTMTLVLCQVRSSVLSGSQALPRPRW